MSTEEAIEFRTIKNIKYGVSKLRDPNRMGKRTEMMTKGAIVINIYRILAIFSSE
jgi:hypothetical protein